MRRVKEQTKAGVSPSRAPVPEVTFQAAQVRVRKLEEVSSLWQIAQAWKSMLASSSDTHQSCRGPTSVGVQVVQCQQFIERTVKRIEELDRARETESGRLQEGRQRLQRLQQEAAAGAQTVSNRSAAPDVASEAVRLQDQVAHR